MPWYTNTLTRATWHVIEQRVNGARTIRSHAAQAAALADLQRRMLRYSVDGHTLCSIAVDRVGVLLDHYPVAWIGYERCKQLVCSGCDALAEAA